MTARRNKTSNVRKAIRQLQVLPVVLSLFVLTGYITDIFCINLMWFLCPMFGYSIYVLSTLYSMSRKMYVSRWSRVLYINLIAVVCIELVDEIFGLSLRFIEFQQYVMSMFIVGIIVSLCTFIYDKFKHGF